MFGTDGSTPVMLGELELIGLEVPNFYDRGGSMQAAVHHLVGGGRVIQLMGPDRARRRLQGCFVGPFAADKAQELEAVRDAAEPLVLAIGAWCELVVVTSVIVRYAACGSVVEYLLDAEPIFDAPSAPGPTFGMIVSAAAGDLAGAGGAVGAAINPSIAASGALGAAQAGILTACTALAARSSAIANPNTVPSIVLSATSDALQNTIATASTAIAGIAAEAGQGDLVVDAPALLVAQDNALLIVEAVIASALVTRASASLTALQPGSIT